MQLWYMQCNLGFALLQSALLHKLFLIYNTLYVTMIYFSYQCFLKIFSGIVILYLSHFGIKILRSQKKLFILKCYNRMFHPKMSWWMISRSGFIRKHITILINDLNQIKIEPNHNFAIHQYSVLSKYVLRSKPNLI